MTAVGESIALLPHPRTPCAAVEALEVHVDLAPDGTLGLRYRLHGDLGRLRIPSPRPAARVDGLWAHTCFECFVAAPGTRAYREFNFSPSGEWAAYAFRAYREGDDEAMPTLAVAPRVVVHAAGRRLDVDVRVHAAALSAGNLDGLQLGLTAVIEDIDGKRSYWALRHPGPAPDFHLRDGFALTIGPAAGIPWLRQRTP
ncbi:DOMON-like domain-containing protein [Aromatoleum buckelii]|uniref:DOMON-like domain-containing protein n=1 Tax=Aromatoleum buckelii TaxID=200254 RepID=A0ABX1MY75_9RHOO|nr:DOMON-like domain-containing protein [Aromatoleum buckelii]MCK0509960.1 DOMON-like domain-containing protein [Aromatoleum buckelii]